jgi:hypothetical protein
MFKSRRSITSPTGHSSSVFNSNIVAMPLQSVNTFGTINITNTYNDQFNQLFTSLNERRQDLQAKVGSLPQGDTSLRNNGVTLAWKYEQAELEMGGKGSADWNESQRQEILDRGKVRGAEGHHINSVKEHTSQQADPDNIKFTKSRQEHLAEHKGDWKNATEGDLIDRNKRLEEINSQRVFKNELTGIGLAAAIGLGIGFTIGAVTTLAKQGISVKNVIEATNVGLKTGVESSMLAVINYGIVRGIGEATTSALTQVAVEKLGFKLTENLLKMCNMAIVGAVSSIVFSTWVFVKMKWKGHATSLALKKAGKTLGYSLSVLFISIVAQGIWGGHAGIIVSLCVGGSMVLFQFIKYQLNIKLLESVRRYTIENLHPMF